MPADGIKGQRNTDSLGSRGGNTLYVSIYGRAVHGVEGKIPSGNTAVGYVGIGTGQHHIGGDDAVNRQRGTGPIGAAARGFNRAVHHGLDLSVLKRSDANRTGCYCGVIYVGLHIATNVVTNRQYADGDGIRIGYIESLGY